MFWFFAAALVLLAVLFVLLPLWKIHRAGESGRARREQTNLLIFQERVAELEAERAAGTLEEENFQELKRELQRSLLSDVDAGAADVQSKAESSVSLFSRSRLIPLLLVLMVPPATYLLYEQWGYQDELELAQLGERTRAGVTNAEEARDLIFAIGEIVQSDPENGWAWFFLAQNLVNLGQFPEAAMSLERAAANIAEPQDKAEILSQQAYLEYFLAEQKLTDKVQGIIDAIQLINPNHQIVLDILGMDAEQRGDYQTAITYLRRILQSTPPGAVADDLNARIANAQQQLAASGAAPQDGAQIAAEEGPTIEVQLSVGADLNLPADTRVFVSALEVNGRGQPLAAEAMTVGDLPVTITLTNADAVGPFNLSSAEQIYIVATASSSGTANVQAGDHQARSEGFAHGNTHAIIPLVIENIVP
ncbi:MAG: c-type cytochrome biogenesis protein CcmI [Gammaproteobacteria bacterium]|nr:c-type cytochrome biogenesis protein CcmI [Gammaproteobacteria bacterium]